MKKLKLVSNRDQKQVLKPESSQTDIVSVSDLTDWTYDAVKSIMETLRIVDPSTYQHCLRVGETCRRLARDLGLNEIQQKSAHFSGILHDVGKIGIAASILHKPSRLTDQEFEVMKSHSCLSEQIVQPLANKNEFIHQLLSGIRGHHERIDGAGYPDHLEGDAIPLYSRIIFVCDTYDAMKNSRAYRNGLDNETVYAELKRCAGTQFDYQIVKTFLEAHPNWNDSKDIDPEVFQKIAQPTKNDRKKTA